jgi:hypothetical protein
MLEHRLLSTYLNDHLAGATAGVELFRRARDGSVEDEEREALDSLAAEVAEDRATLRQLMADLGVAENRPMKVAGWLAEKAGRLKPNGYLVQRSPLSDVIELEALRTAVAGKTAGWQSLRLMAREDHRLSVDQLDALIARAEQQSQQLRDMHLRAAERHLTRKSA